MNTAIYKIEQPEGPLSENDLRAIDECAAIIRNGGLVAFPTETVYGLGGDALNEGSSGRIYSAKGRPSDNPLIVHIADMASLKGIVSDIPEECRILAERFWPGPLTMVLRSSGRVPRRTTGGLDTVAVRWPDNPTACRLIKLSGGYIAAPSANISGRPSPTAFKYVLEDMDGRIDAIIDGGVNPIGLESTIVDLAGDRIMVLRPGFITCEMLSEALGREVVIDPAILDPDYRERPKAPGMRYRHYAPRGEVRPVRGKDDAVSEYIARGLAEAKKEGKKTGVFCSSEHADRYDADVIRSAGTLDDAPGAAHEFYSALRDMDDENVDVIFVENFTDRGFGQAFWNRLLKSAGSKWEEVI